MARRAESGRRSRDREVDGRQARRKRRPRTYDNAISSALLRFVHRGIRRLDECARTRRFGREVRDAEGCRDTRRRAARETLLDALSEALREMHSLFSRCFAQEDTELLASVT